MTFILSQEDFTKLLEYPKNPKHRLILRLLYATGMRTKELVTLRIENIDFHKHTIKILDCKKKKCFELFLDKETIRLLQEYVDRKEGYLFPSKRKEGYITTKVIQKLFRKWSKELNIPIRCPRFFRYRIARLWVVKKGSLTDLQQILRHTQLQTTFRYIEKIRFEEEIENLREEYNRIIR